MKVVVTGGAGFIGSNLCRRLLSDGQASEIVVLDDLSTGNDGNLANVPVTLVRGSILDTSTVADVMAGARSVVHLAARPSVPRSIKDPVQSHDVNATGTVNILEAARRVGAHVIVASSSSVYGATKELPKREDLPTAPMSPYAASKLASESYALAYSASFNLPVLAFRFFNVYGPRQPAGHAYAAVIPAFIDAALRGRPLPVFGDGSQSRDFTFVGTVCEVLSAAVRRQVAHPAPVNLAYGSRTSLLSLVQILEGALDRHLEVEHLPARVGDVPHSQAANERLRSLFPDVSPEPLEVGLRHTLQWFLSNPLL